jgi:hypothetical protein
MSRITPVQGLINLKEGPILLCWNETKSNISSNGNMHRVGKQHPNKTKSES